MVEQCEGLVSLLLGLIPSLVACMQLDLAMLTAHLNYVKQRVDIFKMTPKTVETTRKTTLSPTILGCDKDEPVRAWWDSFVNQIIIEEEWRKNFRIGGNLLYNLAHQLRPLIEVKTTIMRGPVDAVKQVAVTL